MDSQKLRNSEQLGMMTDLQLRSPQIYSKTFIYMQEFLDEDLTPEQCTERTTFFHDDDTDADLPLL